MTGYSDVFCVSVAKRAVDNLLSLSSDERFTSDTTGLATLGYDCQQFGTYFSNFYTNMSTVDVDRLSSLATGFSTLITSLADASTLTTANIDSFGVSLSGIATGGIADFIAAFNDSETDVTTAVDAFLGYAIAAMSPDQTTFSTAGDECVASYLDAFGDKQHRSTAKDAAENLIRIVTTALHSQGNRFRNEGRTSISEYIKGIQNQAAAVRNAASTLTKNVISGLGSNSASFRSSGSSAASSYVGGISSNNNSAYTAGGTLAKMAKDGLAPVETDTRTIGNNFAKGFIAGMKDYDSQVYRAAYNLGRTAIRGLNTALNSHSPSREAIASGGNFGIGFVSGMIRWVAQASETAASLGNATVDSLNKAISKVPEIVSGEMNFDPVIRPVIDLSNAQASAATLNSMFNKSISIAADVASVTNSSVQTARARIEGTETGPLGTTAQDQNPGTVIFNNKFEITSDQPEEVANEVSRRIQKQIERKEATWASSSGTRSPLVRSR